MVGIFFLITNFFVCKYSKIKGAIVVVFVWLLDLQLPMKSEPITTIVVSLNPAQARCTRYNILWWSFPTTCDRSVVFQSTLVSSTNKTQPRYNWNIVESGVKHHTLSLSKIKFSPNPKNVCVERMEGVNGISGWSRVLYVYRFTFIVELNWFIYIICINKNLGNVIEYRNKHYQLYIFIFVIILFCL